MPTQPTDRDYLRSIALQLDQAPHGQRSAIVAKAAAQIGIGRNALYARLRREVGWDSQRKCRADKGRTTVPAETLDTLAAMQKVTMRANGKQVLHAPTAISIAASSGIDLPVGASQLTRLMRQRKLDMKSQAAERPVQPLAAPHPNHTHEVDPSLCLLYYLRGQQVMIRDDQQYKNKDALGKVKLKVWRYVLYDRASAVIKFRYYEAAGESQENLFDFLMWAWGKQPGITPFGACKKLLWDAGSANTGFATTRGLDALEVKHIVHTPGAPRVKGGVENANNIVECGFESRLAFEPVQSVEELNAAAQAWQEAYNANRLPSQDTRLRRPGIAPTARLDLWMRIRADQLRELPDVETLRGYLEGSSKTRHVKKDMTISYRHPGGTGPRRYDLRGLDGVCVDDKVEVRPLVFGNEVITIRVARYDGEPLVYRLEPTIEYDEYGQVIGAAKIGEEYKGMPDTAIEHAAKRMDALAFPDAKTADEIRRARRGGVVPFGGDMKSITSLHDIEQTTYLPKNGTPIELRSPIAAEAPLTLTDAALALRGRGVERADLYQWLAARYPDGSVPAADIDAMAQPEARGGEGVLRVISGGAA